MKKYLRLSYLPILSILLCTAGFIFLVPHFLGAQTVPPSDVRGYAVADMSELFDQTLNPGNSLGGLGFGWISMSSFDDGSSQEYGVMFDTNTGLFSRQAWSEYGGWLETDHVGAYPEAPSYSARVNNIATCLQGTSLCPVTGWMKFTAGGTPQSGGWDGWIKMSGLTTNGNSYGVFLDPVSGAMSGQAWGGGVVGWVDFSNVQVLLSPLDTCPNIPGDQDIPWMNQNSYRFSTTTVPPACVYDKCYLDTNADGYWDFFDGNNPACMPGGQVDITATACNAGSSTITWNSWDPSGSVSCTASGGFGFSGTVGPTGSMSVSNLPDGQTTFTLGPCTDSTGAIITDFQSQATTASTVVQCGPVVTTSIDVSFVDPQIVLNDCKDPALLKWNISTQGGTTPVSCQAIVGGQYGWNGTFHALGGNGPETVNDSNQNVISDPGQQFGIKCTDSDGNTDSDYMFVVCGVQPNPEICGNGQDEDGDNIDANGVAHFNPDGSPMDADEGCIGIGGGIGPIYQET